MIIIKCLGMKFYAPSISNARMTPRPTYASNEMILPNTRHEYGYVLTQLRLVVDFLESARAGPLTR